MAGASANMDRTDAQDDAQSRNGLESVANRPASESTDLQDSFVDRESNGKLAASVATEMRSVLAQLELLSHGKTQSFNAMSRGENDNPRPFGESNPPHIIFRERWDAAPAHRRPEILAEARIELETARKAPQDRPEQTGDMDAWIVEDGEGWEVEVIARRFNTTPSHIRKVRIDAGRCGEFGKPYVEPQLVDKTERVLYLLGKQMSVRAVAAQVGMHATQVQRIKARKAA